eukprot:Lithocolla_globosa_v1_NODE_1139_length_2842_cov_6.310011.p3 type:complete len:236 gc:universal NODE_1139_length_2842_cov_6.310011:2425-1718(-)
MIQSTSFFYFPFGIYTTFVVTFCLLWLYHHDKPLLQVRNKFLVFFNIFYTSSFMTFLAYSASNPSHQLLCSVNLWFWAMLMPIWALSFMLRMCHLYFLARINELKELQNETGIQGITCVIPKYLKIFFSTHGFVVVVFSGGLSHILFHGISLATFFPIDPAMPYPNCLEGHFYIIFFFACFYWCFLGSVAFLIRSVRDPFFFSREITQVSLTTISKTAAPRVGGRHLHLSKEGMS